MKRILLTMKGHLRPYRSAAIPMESVKICYIEWCCRGFTKYRATNGSEHQHQGNAPGNLGIRFSKLLGQLLDRERDGEEVKGIPRPSQETDKEEHPLLEVE